MLEVAEDERCAGDVADLALGLAVMCWRGASGQ
jgi:hypothetical protein